MNAIRRRRWLTRPSGSYKRVRALRESQWRLQSNRTRGGEGKGRGGGREGRGEGKGDESVQVDNLASSVSSLVSLFFLISSCSICSWLAFKYFDFFLLAFFSSSPSSSHLLLYFLIIFSSSFSFLSPFSLASSLSSCLQTLCVSECLRVFL